jgi:hypothetical protein
MSSNLRSQHAAREPAALQHQVQALAQPRQAGRLGHKGIVLIEAGPHLGLAQAGVQRNQGAGSARVKAQGPAHGHTVHTGHFDIQDHGVEILGLRSFEG